ncbi:MAG: TIGR00341 family protein [Bacteroidaceae bacterium]|nr:TIGR00341 family protein [Bacteroidaceae bacterium]
MRLRQRLAQRFTTLFRETIRLTDYIDTSAAEKSIRSNIYFRGPNAWILAIATIIASVGLNVNSIPVIIGAMLISPLMGPIFGVGLGLGINDMQLIKSSGKNLLVMVSISLVASFVYFLITPLNLTNPSELLARTNPTIYDVLIALFGGFAGILEQCRKEKGTVFAGVAIATALMPPLCTAGFGLASGNFGYFLGAAYLFVINCIFIMLATYISVKYFGFREVTFADALVQRRTRTFSTALIILFIVPSIWSAVTFIRQNNFEGNATAFAEQCKVYGRTILYDYKIDHADGSVISLFFSGDPLSEQTRRDLLTQAAEYGIKEEQVLINEYSTTIQDNNVELVKSIYDRMDTEVSRRDAEISRLRQQLAASEKEELPYVQLAREIMGIYPSVKDVVLARGATVSADSLYAAPCLSVVVHRDSVFTPAEMSQLSEWLRVRLATDMEVVILQR